MKERIREVMESLHMTQQEFAERTQIGAATLSNIFNDRTRPTLNVVELIKKNIPDISIDWLLLGTGSMYIENTNQEADAPLAAVNDQNPTFPFADNLAPTPQYGRQGVPNHFANKVVPNKTNDTFPLLQDKPQRRVTEIRVYYDDQTWESFVPSKSK